MKRLLRLSFALMLSGMFMLVLAGGCGAPEKQDPDDFFTSGSREADQRAEQHVAKVEQLRGGETGNGDREHQSLYARLGGEEGIGAIVDDFVARALADPRINWQREGIRRGGLNLLKRKQSMQWQDHPENVARLKKHMAQFIALSSGGPTVYEGRDLRQAHTNLHISNAEFDASIGAMKATLDKLGVPVDEQKELLAIIESTRPQVVERR